MSSRLPRFAPGEILLLAALIAPSLLAAQAAELPEPIAAALKELALDPKRLQPDPIALLSARAKDPATPLLRAIQVDPLKAGYRVGMVEERFRSRADSPHRLFLYTANLTGAEGARGYFGNPLAGIDARLVAAADPLAEALDLMAAVADDFPRGSLPDVAALPRPWRLEVGRLTMAICSAERFRRRAIRKLPVGTAAERALLFSQASTGIVPDPDVMDYRLAIRDVEPEALHAGMLELAAAMEDFDDAAATLAPPPPLDWRLDTPLGEIVLSTADGDTTHTIDSPLLVVDFGGNDHYELGGKDSGARSGISIVYDRAGNDSYDTAPGRGASGFLGYGILWDAAGDDRYRGTELAQGAALFGDAMAIDRGAGADRYEAVRASQGYAMGGAALLFDDGGDDVYTAITDSQASGAPIGAGVLMDTGGNDVYTLANTPLIDPSSQDPKHNSSMGQGCGYGLRADLNDGRSLTGGVGMLLDFAGDDRYTAQVFCQGTGFLEGVGILVDGDGKDSYTGVWYAQASGAHRAAGVLLDRGAGDDVYTAEAYTSICAAHDFSTTFLQDAGGNDRYSVGNFGIGGGQDNGVAIFVDAAGDDEYRVKDKQGYGIGAAKITNWGSSRESALGLGLFFDLGGTDRYRTVKPRVKENATSRWPERFPAMKLPCELGLAVDGEYPASAFPTQALSKSDGADDKVLKETREARRKYRTARW